MHKSSLNFNFTNCFFDRSGNSASWFSSNLLVKKKIRQFQFVWSLALYGFSSWIFHNSTLLYEYLWFLLWNHLKFLFGLILQFLLEFSLQFLRTNFLHSRFPIKFLWTRFFRFRIMIYLLSAVFVAIFLLFNFLHTIFYYKIFTYNIFSYIASYIELGSASFEGLRFLDMSWWFRQIDIPILSKWYGWPAFPIKHCSYSILFKNNMSHYTYDPNKIVFQWDVEVNHHKMLLNW